MVASLRDTIVLFILISPLDVMVVSACLSCFQLTGVLLMYVPFLHSTSIMDCILCTCQSKWLYSMIKGPRFCGSELCAKKKKKKKKKKKREKKKRKEKKGRDLFQKNNY